MNRETQLYYRREKLIDLNNKNHYTQGERCKKYLELLNRIKIEMNSIRRYNPIQDFLVVSKGMSGFDILMLNNK